MVGQRPRSDMRDQFFPKEATAEVFLTLLHCREEKRAIDLVVDESKRWRSERPFNGPQTKLALSHFVCFSLIQRYLPGRMASVPQVTFG